MNFESFLFPLIFLIGSTSLAALNQAMQSLGRIQIKTEFKGNPGLYFFYYFVRNLFPKDGWDNLFFLNATSKQINRILYATTLIFYLLSQKFFSSALVHDGDHYLLNSSRFFIAIAVVIAIGLFFDFLGVLFGLVLPKLALKILTPIASVFLLAFSPITFFLLKLKKLLLRKSSDQKPSVILHPIKEKILELVMESDADHELDPQGKKLILSVASFQDRIAREVMVPRIDVFSMPASASIEEAAKQFINEGYSRIPIYKNSVDNIIGVLLYKDILSFYIGYETNQAGSPKETTIETLLKPIVYTPETKKISHLLQEFRAKQLHLAIVVDEYGGTEGIVTIEDILEELVGEIADEYDDKQEESLYAPHSSGGWVVDGKMNIIDIEKELEIQIPKSPEYDSIGGYVFHRAGAIPTKGWRIHHENFDLEILSTSERSVESVLIIPTPNQDL